MTLHRSLATVALGIAASLSAPAFAEESPGVAALQEFREGRPAPDVVQNKFFIKKGRFDIGLSAGFVPNNPFAQRISGNLDFGYHFMETLSVRGNFGYGGGPLKSLVPVLLDRAYDGGNTDFQQPYSKVSLTADFGVQWSPFYGKISLLGEVVANFDVWGYIGMGMVLKDNYYATYNPAGEGTGNPFDIVDSSKAATKVLASPVVAIGANFFVSQMVAIRLGGRFHLYVDDKPVYVEGEAPDGKTLYNMFNATIGVAVYLPKMKPRLSNF